MDVVQDKLAEVSLKDKKLNKGKEKKLLRKQQQQERLAVNQEKGRKLWSARFMDEAGQIPRNVLQDVLPFAKFDRNGLDLEIKFFAKQTGVPDEVLKFAFDLTERNMKEMYIAAGWGWNENKKRKELQDEEARLLVAFDKESGEPVGFIHFRFFREDDDLIIYVYELQVEQEKAQRKGLGRHFMMIAELVGRKCGMEFAMLTVLNCNEPAQQFYSKLKYQEDEYNDLASRFGVDEGEERTYKVLSKPLCLPSKPN